MQFHEERRTEPHICIFKNYFGSHPNITWRSHTKIWSCSPPHFQAELHNHSHSSSSSGRGLSLEYLPKTKEELASTEPRGVTRSFWGGLILLLHHARSNNMHVTFCKLTYGAGWFFFHSWCTVTHLLNYFKPKILTRWISHLTSEHSVNPGFDGKWMSFYC